MSTENFIQSLKNLAKAADQVAEAYREQTAQAPAPTGAEASFSYRDPDGDLVGVFPHPNPDDSRVLRVATSDDKNATTSQTDLSQDAVNRLAQYIDRHRTDTPKAGVNPGLVCAGFKQTGADRSGCAHLRSDHGAHDHAHDETGSLRCQGSRGGVYGA